MRRLKLVRVAAEKTQVALAAETDISQTRLSLLEREIVMPTDAERAALAKALGVPASTLFRSVTTPARAGATPELV